MFNHQENDEERRIREEEEAKERTIYVSKINRESSNEMVDKPKPANFLFKMKKKKSPIKIVSRCNNVDLELSDAGFDKGALETTEELTGTQKFERALDMLEDKFAREDQELGEDSFNVNFDRKSSDKYDNI